MGFRLLSASATATSPRSGPGVVLPLFSGQIICSELRVPFSKVPLCSQPKSLSGSHLRFPLCSFCHSSFSLTWVFAMYDPSMVTPRLRGDIGQHISGPKQYSAPQAFAAILDPTAYHRIPDHCLDFRTLLPDHGSLVTCPT